MLSVAGVAIATIEGVQPMHFGGSEELFQTKLMALWKMVITNLAFSDDTKISQLSAMCDALCCGLFRHISIPNRDDLPDLKSVMQTLKSKLATDALFYGVVDSTDEWALYQRNVGYLCRDRSFFVTTEGSVGIAPLSARPGDTVCVLLGCYSTILLRQTKDDTYQFVGQSYMPGVHAGEALLGPLPEHLRPVQYYDEVAKKFHFGYWNEHEGIVQFKDPRLDKLLRNPGFEVREQGEDRFPRIETSVEALRNAGIAAQYFDLV